MPIECDKILQAALKLPERERLTLISRLFESVPPDDQGVSLDDEELIEELDRRFADPDGAVSWAELRAEC